MLIREGSTSINDPQIREHEILSGRGAPIEQGFLLILQFDNAVVLSGLGGFKQTTPLPFHSFQVEYKHVIEEWFLRFTSKYIQIVI